MTDRYNMLTVVLAKDIREDDAAALINAIRMLKGVLAVEPHVADPQDFLAELRAREHLRAKLHWVLFDHPISEET